MKELKVERKREVDFVSPQQIVGAVLMGARHKLEPHTLSGTVANNKFVKLETVFNANLFGADTFRFIRK